MTDTPVILLHGLGQTTLPLLVSQQYLQYCGFKTVHRVYYPVRTKSIEECLEYLDKELQRLVDKEHPILVVGHSMGGVVAFNLHHKGWKVRKALALGSPLNGAWLCRFAARWLPENWLNAIVSGHAKRLCDTGSAMEPPHPYHTVSFSLPFTEFDGNVSPCDVKIKDAHHTHIGWTGHSAPYFDPRVLRLVYDQLVNST